MTQCKTVSYEQGSEALPIMFALQCVNVPTGTILTLSSDNPSEPSVIIGPTTVTNYPSFTVGVTCNIPANYNTKLTYCYTLPAGVQPPAGFSIQLVAFITTQSAMKVLK